MSYRNLILGGPHLAVLGLFLAQESVLPGSGGHIRLGMEPALAACKANALSDVLSLQSRVIRIFFRGEDFT